MTSKLFIAFHTGPAELFDPTENDGFVLLGTFANRYKKLPGVFKSFTFKTFTLMTISLVFYFIGTLVLFPVSLGLLIMSKTTSYEEIEKRG